MKKARLILLVIFVIQLLCIFCGPPPAPKEYTHTEAGFKFTAAAGWNLVNKDNELCEFRMGNFKLVEVGGFDLELKPSDLAAFGDEVIAELLEKSTLGGLEGYCEEANIKDYTVTEKTPTTWAGLPAYKIKAKGYSKEIDEQVIVDILVAFLIPKARMFMFSSQVISSEYSKTEADLLSMLASFQLLP